MTGIETQGHVYRFGEWVVEPHLNRIRSDDVEHQLEPRSIQVLQFLLDNPGETVSIDSLLDAVWADRVVEPNAVHRNLARIRRALGDDSKAPRYIETISKRGYRTVAPVSRVQVPFDDTQLKRTLEPITPPYPAYEGDEAFTFVCYSHKDREVVYRELQRLREAGINVWYDEGISPGSEWEEEIAGAIRRCSHFLYFVSPQSVTSKHCLDELQYARSQDRPLVIVHIEPTTLPASLELAIGRLQALFKYMLREREYARKLIVRLTTPGQFEITRDAPDGNRWRKLFSRTLAAGVVLLLVWTAYEQVSHRLRGAAENSITIGRFEDLSPSSDQQWLGGSIVSEVRVLLPQHGFQVVGIPGGDGASDPAAIARYIVHGSVMRSRNRIRVTAVLASTDSERQLWADIFDEYVEDGEPANHDFATRIAAAVAGHLTGNQTPRLINTTPVDASAGALQQIPTGAGGFSTFPGLEEGEDE